MFQRTPSGYPDITTRPTPVRHPGPCGDRCPAPCGRAWGPYKLAEALPGGRVRCHGCGRTLAGQDLAVARTGRCAA